MALLALCKGGNRSRHSFKNSDESNLLLLLFQEERKEGFTLLKEQITLSLFLSQKRVIHTKNQGANSPP